MKLFSAMFDVILLPVSVAHDLVNPFPMVCNGEDSKTRQRIEKIEEELGL